MQLFLLNGSRGNSDENIEIAGKAYLHLDFLPANAHDETFENFTENPDRPLDMSSLVDIIQSADHGGVVSYVVGLSASEPYRVLELSEPTRLVLDVRHGQK